MTLDDMNLDAADLKKQFVEEVRSAARSMARISSPNALLSTQDIAFLAGFNPDSSALRTCLSDPDFPRQINFGERARRWVAKEVLDYFDRKRAEQLL